MIKLIVGIALSVIFIYFTMRGLQYDQVVRSLEHVHYVYLLPAVLLIILLSVFKSLRWSLILSPIKHIEQKKLFPITCIGFMSVVLLPMRVGELMRPWMISSQKHMPFSSVLATIFVERVLDVVTILGIFFIVMMQSSLPPWFVKSGYTAFAVFVVMLFCMFFLYFRTKTALVLLGPVLRRLPPGPREKIEHLIFNFVDGFRIIASPAVMTGTLLLSILIWTISGAVIYVLFQFHNFDLSLMAAFAVLVVTVIGISLPAAPGMLGNFQFSCIVALSLYGLSKDNAFVFSMVYYFIGIGMVILMGLVFLPFTDFSFPDAIRKLKRRTDTG